MTITILGFVTLIISIYAFFKNEKLLLYMVVFLSTFTAAELGDIKATTTPIQTFEFTGAVWLLREFINFVKLRPKITKEIIINKFKENNIALAFVFFIISIILGEITLVISGISVEYIDVFGNQRMVKFGLSNITQSSILIFMFIIMIVLSFKIKTKEEVKELLRVFCISAMFAVIWGLLQFITYYFGIQYPAFLFNNNNYALQGYNQIENNIKRISSIALEPSMFSITLIALLAFLMGTFLKTNINLKNKKHLVLILGLLATTICTILTTSSISYVGLVIVYGFFLVYILFGFIKGGELSNRKHNFIKILVSTVASIALASMICIVFVKIGYKLGTIGEKTTIEEKNSEKENENVIKKEEKYNKDIKAYDNMTTTLKQMTIQKLKTGSALERINGEKVGFSMLKYSPVFGIGFGSYRTYSLFTTVLVNAGIFGEITFLYILFVVIREIMKLRNEEETMSIMLLVSILGMTLGFFIRSSRLINNALLDYTCTWIQICKTE